MRISFSKKIAVTESVFIFLGLSVITLILWGIWLFIKEIAFQSRYFPNIEKALGLEIESPYVNDREVFRYQVKANEYAYQKGLRSGDILMRHPEDSYGIDVHKTFFNSQGRSVTFYILREDREIKIIFDDIPQIGNECLSQKTSFSNDPFFIFSGFNWLIERAGGCPL